MTKEEFVRILKRFFVICTSFVIVIIFIRGARLPAQASWSWLFVAFLLNPAYGVSKSVALYLISREIRPAVSFPLVLKAFFKSVTVGIGTFSGKIGFGAALFANMGAHLSKKESAAILSLYTGANLSVFLTFFPLILPFPINHPLLWVAFLFLTIYLSLMVFKKIHLGPIFFFIFWGYGINYVQMAVVAKSLGASWNVDLFCAVILADMARAVSQVPFGLGAFDGVFYALSERAKILTVFQLPAFFVLVRLSGELLTAFWGLLIFIFEEVKKDGS